MKLNYSQLKNEFIQKKCINEDKNQQVKTVLNN
jgi:hypothetical protein